MIKNLFPLEHISKHKKSDICFILGTGSSINNISEKEWDVISKHDSWTLNNWIYHPFFVPDFYFVQVKNYDYFIVKKKLE